MQSCDKCGNPAEMCLCEAFERRDKRIAELEEALRMLEIAAIQIEETMIVPRLDWALAFQKAYM